MNESNLLQSLGQACCETAGEIFRTFLRLSVLDMLCQVMVEEVASLCEKNINPRQAIIPEQFLSRAKFSSKTRTRQSFDLEFVKKSLAPSRKWSL